MEGQLRTVYEGKFTDWFPELSATITPPTLQKFQNTTNPVPGVERIFCDRADDPDIASHLKHGVESPPSHTAASLINPLPKTSFQHEIQDKLEAIYLRNRRAPLGKSHDAMLPKDLDILSTIFGTNTIQDVSGGELLNPPKTFEEVDKEAGEGHDLYIVSHDDYYVGEAINRKYGSPNFSKSFVYGIKNPHFKDRRYVSKSLNWQSAPEFIEETKNVPPDHTFGVSLCPYIYGVAELLHHGVPCDILHGKDKGRSLLTKVWQSLKKANYENFDQKHSSIMIGHKGAEAGNLVLKKLESSEKIPEILTRPTDHVFANYQTTSHYSAVVGGLPTTCCPVCGVPSISSALPPPRIRCLSDRTNYGILCNIGMNISDERFEEKRKQASMKHQKEEVCVESIKNILDKIYASHTETGC